MIPSLACGSIKCASGTCSSFLFLFQQETDELQLAAGKTLVALAGTFYNEVMHELQSHVDIMELPPLFIVITLGALASAYGTASPPPLPGSERDLGREGTNTASAHNSAGFGAQGVWLLALR